MRTKLICGIAILVVVGCTTSCITFEYGSPFKTREWSPPAFVQPELGSLSSLLGISVAVNGSTDLSTPVAGLKLGLDWGLGGYFDQKVGWNLSLGASALGAYVRPARAPTGTPPKTSTYTSQVPASFAYGASSQISGLILFSLPGPIKAFIGIGPSAGFAFERGPYYETRKDFARYESVSGLSQGWGSTSVPFESKVSNNSDSGMTFGIGGDLVGISAVREGVFWSFGIKLGGRSANFPYSSNGLGTPVFNAWGAYQADLIRVYGMFGSSGDELSLEFGSEFFIAQAPPW